MSDDTDIGRAAGEFEGIPLRAWGATPLDYRALTDPVDRVAVIEYRRRSQRTGAPWALGMVVRVIAITLMVFVGVMFLTVASVTVSLFTGQTRSGLWLLVPVVVAVVAVLLIVWWVRTGPHGQWVRWYRFDQFARANGLVAEPLAPGLMYPGAIFQHGNARAGFDRLHSAGGRTLDLGNYRYTIGSGDNQRTSTWGYLALQLDRPMPHMLLDSRSNNGLFGTTNLPISVAHNQQLRLEGDFNSHFTLYCPQEYETDALYVFTPDLMALLIDNAGDFDVEIVDGWMFVYSATPFTMTDPAVLRRLFTIVSTVGAKTLKQTEHYRDERMLPAGSGAGNRTAASIGEVAPEGRRLKFKNGWVGVVVIIAFALLWVWSLFSQR